MKQYLIAPLKHAKKDKGTAGLTILLSLIVMLFVIGLIVMIFSLMSGSLQSGLDNSASGNQSKQIINATGASIASVTTYFPLFVTIGAMVVLILLTVIIITAIRSSGLVSTGTA